MSDWGPGIQGLGFGAAPRQAGKLCCQMLHSLAQPCPGQAGCPRCSVDAARSVWPAPAGWQTLMLPPVRSVRGCSCPCTAWRSQWRRPTRPNTASSKSLAQSLTEVRAACPAPQAWPLALLAVLALLCSCERTVRLGLPVCQACAVLLPRQRHAQALTCLHLHTLTPPAALHDTVCGPTAVGVAQQPGRARPRRQRCRPVPDSLPRCYLAGVQGTPDLLSPRSFRRIFWG